MSQNMRMYLLSLMEKRNQTLGSNTSLEHIRVREPIRRNPNLIHLVIQIQDLLAITRQRKRSKERIPNIYSSLMSCIKHLPCVVNGVQLRVHINEFGGQERVLIEPSIGEVAMNVKAIGEGVQAGAREDKELIGLLGWVGLMREDLKGLLETALFA
jgi:hypothetical protein